MTKNDIRTLFQEIMDIYGDGVKGAAGTADAWCNRLGAMSLETARRILDDHIRSDNGNRPPTLHTFLSAPLQAQAVYDNRVRIMRIRDADTLEDTEGYEYGNPYGEMYFYTADGRIARHDPRLGQIVVQ